MPRLARAALDAKLLAGRTGYDVVVPGNNARRQNREFARFKNVR
jgi:hypothetical protein